MRYKFNDAPELICLSPLTLRHAYTEPKERTIEKGERWILLSENKTKGECLLEKVDPTGPQIRCRITTHDFTRHFMYVEKQMSITL